VNPVAGRRELILVSREQEKAAGREGAQQVAAAMGIFAEPRLSACVAAIGARVAVHSPREQIDWRFEIVDQEAPNAFALPDGHIHVSRGLLELANPVGQRLVRVRANEGIAALTRRTGSTGEPGYAALANGLVPDAVPAAGSLLKIALEGPYVGLAAEAEPSPGG
jgi:predicted Zn-dependent protease